MIIECEHIATEGNEWKPVRFSVYVPENKLSSMTILPVFACGDNGSISMLFNSKMYVLVVAVAVDVFVVC